MGGQRWSLGTACSTAHSSSSPATAGTTCRRARERGEQRSDPSGGACPCASGSRRRSGCAPPPRGRRRHPARHAPPDLPRDPRARAPSASACGGLTGGLGGLTGAAWAIRTGPGLLGCGLTLATPDPNIGVVLVGRRADRGNMSGIGVLGIDNVLFDVGDLEAARRFYGELLGLEEKFAFPRVGLVCFRLGDEEPGLLVRASGAEPE